MVASSVGIITTVSANTLTGNTLSSNVVNSSLTSVGTLGSLSVTGNVSSGNLNVTGNLVDTGALSIITGSSGNISLAPNGTNVLVATTTGANIAGTLNATGNANVGNLGATNIVGTLTTAAQTNITSVGTLGSLSVTGNITGNYILGNGSQLTGISAGGGTSITNGTSNVAVAASSNVTVGVAGTPNVATFTTVGIIANSVATTNNGGAFNFKVGDDAWIGDINTADTIGIRGQQNNANGYIVFGNADATTKLGRAGSGPLTYDSAFSATGNVTGGNLLTSGNIVDTGAMSIITGASGNVSLAPNGTNVLVATTTGANITGTLNATGNANVGNLGATNIVGTLTTAAQTNITSVGTLSSLSVTGNITGGNILGGANVNATTHTGTTVSVTGNITGGNLLINTNAVITGNLSVLGTETIFNVANLTVNDKDIIVANNVTGGANVNGAGIQAGNPATATWFFNNATTSWQSNIAITPTANGTLALGGTSNYWGAAYVTTLTASGNANVGNLGAATVTATTLTGTLSTAAQTNITSVGTLGSLSVTGNITSGNLSGTSIVGTLTTAAQTNITSVGTLGSLSVTGNITSGNIIATLNGSGANVTSISATNISSGTLAQARLANASLTVNGTSIALGGSGTVTATATNALTIGTGLGGTSYNGSTGVTITNTGVTSAVAGTGIGVSGATGAVTITNSGVTSVVAGTNIAVSGATGAVTVSVSGTVASATTASQIDSIEFRNGDASNGTSPDNVNNNGTGYVTSVSLFGQTDGALYSQAYSTAWVHQIFGDYRTGQLAVRGRNSGTLTSWRTILDSTNYTSYAPTLTGTGASGTWSINVTGSAGSATTATSATTAGTVTTAAQGNITSVGTLTALAVSGAITVNSGAAATAIVNGATTGVGNIGSSTVAFNTVFAKATSAQYADVAENYLADADYPIGTVLEFGGDAEITISKESHSSAVAGTVSDKPAYIMNSGLTGEHVTTVALLGRVPCRVVGQICKGNLLVSSHIPGVATALDKPQWQPGCVIGKALEEYNSDEPGVIEVVIGRF
jgi:hypothetical protein